MSKSAWFFSVPRYSSFCSLTGISFLALRRLTVYNRGHLNEHFQRSFALQELRAAVFCSHLLCVHLRKAMLILEPASILPLEVSRRFLLRFQTGNAGSNAPETETKRSLLGSLDCCPPLFRCHGDSPAASLRELPSSAFAAPCALSRAASGTEALESRYYSLNSFLFVLELANSCIDS